MKTSDRQARAAKGHSRITMQDVAKAAGVSAMTVSRALRNQPVLPKATRIRIQQLARKMGYTPDPRISELMGHLRRKKSPQVSATLGMVWLNSFAGWKEQPGDSRILSASIEKRARELGYGLDEFTVTAQQGTAGLDRMMWSRGIQGFLLASASPKPVTIDIRWERYAVVALDYTLREEGIHRVATDHIQTITCIMKELESRGYSRIGLVMEEEMDIRVDFRWRAGYFAHLSTHPKMGNPHILVIPAFREKPITRWIEKNRIDAVISGGRANRVYDLLVKAGIRIPQNLGYASFQLAGRPALSGMNQSSHEKGCVAVDTLAGLLQTGQFGRAQLPKRIVIPSQWQDGKTLLNRSA